MIRTIPIRESRMLPQKLDTTLAFKAINLAPTLSGTDKRVICAILDHYNRETGQCDPSLTTIAELLGVHRRTVIRAIDRIVRLGFFRRIRHGGHFHRNCYIPNWPRFRALEAQWKDHKKQHRERIRGANLSPLGRQESHPAGDSSATQSSSINNSHERCQWGSANKEHYRPYSLTSVTRQQPQRLSHGVHVKPTSSRQAAWDAAERRWDNAILKRFAGHPVYTQIVKAIDPALSKAATQIEMEKPGSGFWYVLEQLAQRDAIPSSCVEDSSKTGGSQ